MQRLAERQRDFSAALLDAALPVPPGLVGPDGEPSVRRFAVYRNNVVASLTEALMAAFPAVCRIVGDEFFRAMARSYVRSDPPTSPILLDYGAGFPDFVATFEPAMTLPYLPDVARIERAWIEAYHAPEALALQVSDLADIEADRLAEIHLALHPSLRIVRSRLPALTIWRMNVANGVPGPVDLAAGEEDTLVARPAAEVEVRSMPPGGAEFVTSLADGKSIAKAMKAAVTAAPRFDLSGNLAGLIGAGVFVAYGFDEYPALKKHGTGP
ncbi:MAG: putative DNA-binding domain-containing protein [Rhodospirillales bacterium]|nr:putative DNA-binding domain-containing protein [Rhodospirillales bacterium]